MDLAAHDDKPEAADSFSSEHNPLPSSSENNNPLTLVCVTGASGYLGTALVLELLKTKKYFVRATVRNKDDQAKVSHFKKHIPEDQQKNFELHSADITIPNSFDELFKGCKYIFHVAASVFFSSSDPQKEIVDVGVNGTKNVFNSVEKNSDTVKRVVMTSSIAAISGTTTPNNATLTENDWNTSAKVDVDPYNLQKVESEKWSVEFCKGKPFDVVHINPSLILGPVYSEIHTRSSPAIIRDLMTGAFPFAPRFAFPVVDVRDTALAHILAAENPNANGRYILSLPTTPWLLELSTMMKQSFPQYDFPTKEMWDWVMYLVPLFDKRLTFSFVRSHLGKQVYFDNKKVIQELGLKFTDLKTTLIDTCNSLVENGFVPKKP